MSETISHSPSEIAVAEIIIDDTIRSAYTNPDLLKGATMEDVLDLLESDNGDIAVQGMLSEYLAIISLGNEGSFDSRMIEVFKEHGYININASRLKKLLVTGVEKFLDLSKEEQQVRVGKLVAS